MKLYGSYTSPFVRHCRIALMENQVPFEFEPTDYSQSAANSPTKRVPFLRDGELFFTDSSAILHHVRSKADKSFLATPSETELYALANTALDTAINVFLLEKDGITEERSAYVARQKSRITTCLEALNRSDFDFEGRPSDAQWRVACLLAWATYRNRFDYGRYNELCGFLTKVQGIAEFKETAPPPA